MHSGFADLHDKDKLSGCVVKGPGSFAVLHSLSAWMLVRLHLLWCTHHFIFIAVVFQGFKPEREEDSEVEARSPDPSDQSPPLSVCYRTGDSCVCCFSLWMDTM